MMISCIVNRLDEAGEADDDVYVDDSEEEAANVSDDDDEESSGDEDATDEDDLGPAGRRSGRNAVPGALLPCSSGSAYDGWRIGPKAGANLSVWPCSIVQVATSDVEKL
jgi:hypothetical protein